jgi:hypothetical protein
VLLRLLGAGADTARVFRPSSRTPSRRPPSSNSLCRAGESSHGCGQVPCARASFLCVRRSHAPSHAALCNVCRPKPPRLLVYDNACNAEAYCLNREPEYFKDTLFLVDKASHWGWRWAVGSRTVSWRPCAPTTPLAHPQLHMKGHTACSKAYNIALYPEYVGLNSQLAEQKVRVAARCQLRHRHMRSARDVRPPLPLLFCRTPRLPRSEVTRRT